MNLKYQKIEKMNTIKSIFFTAVIFLLVHAAMIGQGKTIPNSFSILNNKTPERKDFYTKSIEAADMEQFRLRDERVKLIFDNGFVLELLSAKELFIKGVQINPNTYTLFYPKDAELPVFTVLPDGHLTGRVNSSSKDKQETKK
jgi:hypothetical protein